MFREILQVFTKEWRQKWEYREFMERHKNAFLLKAEAEPLEDIIGRLKEIGFESNFMMNE